MPFGLARAYCWDLMPHILRAIVTSVILASSAQAGVVINEIMYRPGSTFPEVVAQEFLEIHNTDSTPVDISGWAFRSGVSFTIPAATTIPAGGFIVVANSPAAVQTKYGISGVFGPWTAGGTLSDSGEKVTLSKPGIVAGTWDKVDEVTYSNEGDWATRYRETTFNGWAWQTGADGGNKSMELRNPTISNDNGQNWSASTAALGATPGAVNSVLVANIAPIIKAVSHSPAVPTTAQSVTIKCELNDETPPAGLSATLFWRNAASTTPGAFQTTPMTGDGSGGFSATLAAIPTNLAIVEWYVSATDGALTRTWPAPTTEGQNANCMYQVNNEVFTATDSYYLMVLTGAENAAFNSLAASNPNSDQRFNMTFISTRGGEATVRYRADMRIRGNSSRSYQFKPLRVSIPNDDTWEGITDFAMNPKSSYLQFLGMRLFQAAGLASDNAIPIELRRNGVESTTSTLTTGQNPDFGKWVRIEENDGSYVANHYPLSQGGNIYKKIDNGAALNYYWRSTGGPTPTTPDPLYDGFAKNTNAAVNDWTDLTTFFSVWQTSAQPHFPTAPVGNVAQHNGTRLSGIGAWNGTAFTAAEYAAVSNVTDMNQFAKHLAVMTIIQDLETKLSNGVDDDYAVYFLPPDGSGNRKMTMLPHDIDTAFSLGDAPTGATGTGLYNMTDDGQTFRTLLPLLGNNSTPGNATFRALYHTAIREYYGTIFNASTVGNPYPPFYQFVDQHLTGWVPTTRIDEIKAFATARQTHLLNLIGQSAIVPATATANATVTSAAGSIIITEVLANNVAARLHDGTYPDTIELFNNSAATVDISGYTLTDEPTVPAKYTFPVGTTIDAGGFLIVYADTNLAGSGIHSGFSLDQDGDDVQLRNGALLLDAVTFGPQPADYSICRTGATLNTWALCVPSIGVANTAALALASPTLIKINEWGANPDYLLSGDFVELYNPGAQPAAIGGMHITDDITNYPARHTFPPLSFMAPGGFMRLNAKGGAASPGNGTELAFGLNSSYGYIAFTGVNNTVVDRFDIIAQTRDSSLGRSPNGSDTIVRFALPANPPTPGGSNVAPPAAVLSLIDKLRITELLFRPNELEFVELQNTGSSTLNLSGVQFTSGISYTFDSGVTLLPGAYIVVCKDRAAFLAQYGNSVPLAAGVFTGTLDNAGESVAFQPAPPWNINVLNFSYKSDWFVDATNNHSYVSVAPATTAARDWSDKDSWRLSSVPFGTPGTQEPPVITSALSASANLNGAFSYQITATGGPTSYDATGLPVGFQINTVTGIIDGSSNVGGSYNVTISATNSGGTGSAVLVISVAVNAAPSFTKGANQSVSMDSGLRTVAGWATAISPGPPSESGQMVTFAVSSDNTALFSVQPAVSTNGGLTFTPAAHATGVANITVTAMDNGGTSGGGTDTSAPQFFTITMQPNKAPSFVKGGNRTSGDSIGAVTVSGWATAISPGAGESGQTVSFSVANDNNALFSTQPAVSSNGTLTYTVAGMGGVATVSVSAMDNGGTENGGVNTSAVQTFTITIVGVNDAPSFTAGPNVSVRHNVGAQSIVGWATDISAGPPDESSQTVSFSCINSQNNLFTTQPSISPGGVLTFTPHPVNSGTATVTVTLQDSGGTLDGGVDTVTKQFTITTRAVNDPPSFTPISTQISVGVRTVYGQQFTSAISAGPPDEASQTVSFQLSNSRPDLFTSAPALLPGGVLSFSAGTTVGTAVFTIKAKDNGGVDDGGVDESPSIQVTVRISSALEAIGNYYALVEPAGTNARTNESAGFTKITLAKGGAFSGAIVMGGQKFSLKGKTTDTGVITFSGTGNNSIVLNRKVGADLILGLSIQIGDVPSFKATIKPAGVSSYAGFTATRSIYDGKTSLVPTTLLDPLTDKGKHTAAFLSLAAPNQGLSAAQFPQGDGIGELAISKNGDVKMKGKLADGTSFSMASSLLAGDTIPLYVPLYGANGSLSGVATARSQTTSDIDGSGFFWSRPLIAKPFHPGWPAGVAVDILGAKLLPKATPLFPALTAGDADGNAAVDLSDATIGVKAVNVDAKNKVTVVSPATDKLKVSASASSGKWSGSFTSPTTAKTVKFSGVILRKAGFGTGYYLDGIPGGGVRLSPAP